MHYQHVSEMSNSQMRNQQIFIPKVPRDETRANETEDEHQRHVYAGRDE